MFFVYVIRSAANGLFYVGTATNVADRIGRHNRGENKSTKAYRPWNLFFSESFAVREDAKKRELFLKSEAGREFIESRWGP